MWVKEPCAPIEAVCAKLHLYLSGDPVSLFIPRPSFPIYPETQFRHYLVRGGYYAGCGTIPRRRLLEQSKAAIAADPTRYWAGVTRYYPCDLEALRECLHAAYDDVRRAEGRSGASAEKSHSAGVWAGEQHGCRVPSRPRRVGRFHFVMRQD